MQDKKKKIGFNLYLLKTSHLKSEERYPVYLRINFNGENTKLKEVLFNDHTLYWTKDDLAKWKSGDFKGRPDFQIEEMKKAIEFYENIIRFEYEKQVNDHTLNGFAARARYYRRLVPNKIEQKVLYSSAVELSLGNDFSFFSKIALEGSFAAIIGYKGEISNTLQTMIELHILVQLFTMPYFNLRFPDYFGSTLYSFVIKDGLNLFSVFLENYFSEGGNNLDYKYLADRFSQNTPESRNLKPLLDKFSPVLHKKELYFNLLNAHISYMVQKM